MRFRSLLTALTVGLLALGVTGCGDSNNDNGAFVATTQDTTVATTGRATFNFVTAQTSFTVSNQTNSLRFEFFENGTGQGTPVRTATATFANTVTIENVPVTVQSVRITGYNANNIPLFTINQTISITGGEDNVIPAVNNVTDVLLNQLYLVPTLVQSLDTEAEVMAIALNTLTVPLNGTLQVILVGVYSNGDVVPLTGQATYANDPNDANSANILTVGQLGQLEGEMIGTTNLVVSFGTQELTVPVTVANQLSEILTSIRIIGAPLSVGADSTLQVGVLGNNAQGQTFGLPRDGVTYQLVGDANASINNTGLITTTAAATAGAQYTLTVTYTNPDNSTETANTVVTIE